MTETTLHSPQNAGILPRLGRYMWAFGIVGALLGVLGFGVMLGQRLAPNESDVVELPPRPLSSIAKPAVMPPAVGVNDSAGGLTVTLDEPGKANLGQSAPNFTVQTPQGNTVRLSDYKGQPVVLNFWATWCAPCLIEMPALEQIYRKYKDQGLVVLAVNQAEPADRVSHYMYANGLSFPSVLDPDTGVARLYRVTGYPTTYLVDRQGNLRLLRRGAFSDASQIERLLSDVLTLQ